MLKGEAKKIYQRKYMRDYMHNRRLKGRLLRPLTGTPWIDDIGEFVDSAVKEIEADGNPIYEE